MPDFYVSEPMATVPPTYKSAAQQTIFETLTALGIPFLRVDTGDGTTMEACIPIGERLQNPVIKTVFVTNRQQTRFWLYVTDPALPFVTKDFCGALAIPRVSFASAEKLWELTGVEVGATTILSAILPQAEEVHLVMDRGVAESPFYACTDGTATCFLKLRTSDLLERFLAGKRVVLI